MNTQPKQQNRMLRLSRLWFWALIFFALFLSTFTSATGQVVSNTPCSNDNFTIPSSQTKLTLLRGTSATVQHHLCSQPKQPVTITFELSPTDRIEVRPLTLTLTNTNPQTVTVVALHTVPEETQSTVIIQPKAQSNDSNFNNKKMVSITVTILDKVRVRLPVIHRNIPQWQRVGGQGRDSDLVALHSGFLFLGDRGEKTAGGGVYQAPFTSNNCGQTSVNFTSPPIITASIRDLVLHSDGRGLAGTFGDRVFYSSNQSVMWQATSSSINPYVYAVTFTDDPQKSYAGADAGVYSSSNGGQTWSYMANSPRDVNAFYRNNNQLWIGTFQKGVHVLNINTNLFTQVGNLMGKASEVWDITYAANTYYLATSDGVYRGSGNGAWESIGLPNSIVYSLAVTNEHLYAGLNSRGVQRRPLNLTTDWIPLTEGTGWQTSFTVRDLLYDSNLCKGIFAATNDGVWIYR